MLSNLMTALMGQILPYMEFSDQPLGPLSRDFALLAAILDENSEKLFSGLMARSDVICGGYVEGDQHDLLVMPGQLTVKPKGKH